MHRIAAILIQSFRRENKTRDRQQNINRNGTELSITRSGASFFVPFTLLDCSTCKSLQKLHTHTLIVSNIFYVLYSIISRLFSCFFATVVVVAFSSFFYFVAVFIIFFIARRFCRLICSETNPRTQANRLTSLAREMRYSFAHDFTS